MDAPSLFNLNTLVAAVQNAVKAINGLNVTLMGAFPVPLTSSTTWDPPSVGSGASTSTTVTVAGAALGNYVSVSFSLDLQGMNLTGSVSAADTVTVVLANLTGGAVDLGSGILTVVVRSH